MGVRQKYLLVTTNYEARARGVQKMSSIADARRACPDIVVVDGENLVGDAVVGELSRPTSLIFVACGIHTRILTGRLAQLFSGCCRIFVRKSQLNASGWMNSSSTSRVTSFPCPDQPQSQPQLQKATSMA